MNRLHLQPGDAHPQTQPRTGREKWTQEVAPGHREGLKPVSPLILYTAFTLGKLDRGAAIEMTGMQERTARRLLARLRDDGLLEETSSRSPLYWAIPEHAEPWYFPQLTPGI